MRSDIGLHDLKHLRKAVVESMMVCEGGIWVEGGFTLACFRGGLG